MNTPTLCGLSFTGGVVVGATAIVIAVVLAADAEEEPACTAFAVRTPDAELRQP